MNRDKQVTRKKFLGWSGLAFIGALMVPGKVSSKRGKAASAGAMTVNELRAMSRVCRARGAVEHKTV